MTITSTLSHAQTLVKAFEPFHGHAMAQAEGGFVIGYGHTTSARKGVVISQAEADDLLLYDLGQVGKLLDGWVYAPMNANQRQALIAFGFDIGAANLHKSTAMRRLNMGDYMGCAREIERWRMADLAGRGQVVDALVRRRAAEKALFLALPEGFLNTDTSRLRPRFDGARHGPASVVSEGSSDTPGEVISAAMTAAQNVTARLRALLPDPEADVDPSGQAADVQAGGEEQQETDQPELDLAPPIRATSAAEEGEMAIQALARVPQQDMATAPPPSSEQARADTVLAEPPAEAVVQAPSELASETPAPKTPDPETPAISDLPLPPPPPFVAAARSRIQPPVYANDVSPTGSSTPGSNDVAAESGASRKSSEPDHDAPVTHPTPSLRERFAPLLAIFLKRGHVLVGLVGVLLFAISILAILTGRPSAGNLALGMVGVLLMTPSAYVLLGTPKA